MGSDMSSGFRGATNLGDAYERGDYSRRGRFGPREAGSVMANAPLVGLPSAIAIAAEGAAMKFAPGALPPGVASVSAWLLNLLIWFCFKVVAAWLRNYGGSFLRDLGAAIWQRMADRVSDWRERRQERRKDRKDRMPWRPWRQ